MSEFDCINRTYGLSVKTGSRVRYSGGKDIIRLGTVTGTEGAHLRIRLDGEQYARPYHPTWELEVLP
jgi:hypothetical protein